MENREDSVSTKTRQAAEKAGNSFKAPRVRSAAYPSYTLDFCIEFTKKIHSIFGTSQFIEREQLAKVLSVSVGHIQSQLSSSVQYGLCEMKSKEGYKPSALFIKVYKPISETEKREALIDAILSPDLYNRLITQFKGNQLPSVTGIATILFRSHNIAEAVSEAAAKIFIENLNFLNLLESDGTLRLNRDLEVEELEEEEIKEISLIDNKVSLYSESKPERNKAAHQPNVEVLEQIPSYPIVIPLKGNRTAKLIIPEGYTDEDLNKITRFIEALRDN